MISSQIDPLKSLQRIVFKIRQYRESAEISQKEAAEKLNIGHRSYQRIESGEGNCDISFLHRFSLVFDINFLELVSPYAPEPKNLTLYKNEAEEQAFEMNPFVLNTNFLQLVVNFQAASFREFAEFNSSEVPLCIWTPQKKILNESLLDIFEIEKIFCKVNFKLFKRDERVNFLDCLYYFKPKYSLKMQKGKKINNVMFDIEIYTAHFYKNGEFIGLSVLNITPQQV